MSLIVRDLAPTDSAAWRPLWDAYCAFYEETVPETVTQHTWRQIVTAGSVRGLAADAEGRLVGFATFVLHASTWEVEPVCYLEDLFVDPGARGRGIGRALIDRLIGTARERNWPRVYWHTAGSNRTARTLYDRYASADGFVRYVVKP